MRIKTVTKTSTKVRLAFWSLLCLLLTGQALQANAQDAVAVGAQITSEANIVSGKAYVLQYMATGTPYITEKDGQYSMPNSQNQATEASTYYLISNGDGTWKIKNYYSGKCWGVPVHNTALAAVEESAAGSWSLNFSGGIAYPSAPDAGGTVRGIDRSNQFLWGYTTGTGLTKQIKIYELQTDEINYPVGSNTYKVHVGVQAKSESEIASGEFFVIYQPRNHSYGNEKADNKLALTVDNASPDGTTDASYVFRFISNGDGTYKIQTHSGRYFPAPTSNGVISSSEVAGNYTLNFDANGNSFLRCTNNETTYGMDRGSNQFFANSDVNSTVNSAQCYQLYHATLSSGKISSATAIGGHQTTGLGNTNAILERIQISSILQPVASKLYATLKNDTRNSISSLKVYMTTKNQMNAADANPVLLGTTTDLSSDNVTINLSGSFTDNCYLWLVADIKSDESLINTNIDAQVTGIDYTVNGSEKNFSIATDPAGQIKIFKTQNFVFTPSHTDTEYFRIPALALDKDGGLVAFTDARHISTEDIGKNPAHTIDVVARRSTDNGATWGDVIDVAIVDPATQGANFGYGDAAVARAANGDLVCLMAGGTKSYPAGMTQLYLTKSTDNGQTWSTPVDIFPSINKNGLTITSIFTTSGQGLTTADGTLMFAACCKRAGINYIHVLKSADNGNTWEICANPAYTDGDESKLIQLIDGSLMISVRSASYASGGNRGFNTGSTNGETWGTQYQNETLWGNGSNHDIIYYRGAETRTPYGILLHTMCNSTGREKLTLYMSVDNGTTWNNVYEIQPGLSAYTSMRKLPNGDVAFLFEDGSIRDKSDEYAINYIVMTKEQLDALAEPIVDAYVESQQNSVNDVTYYQAMDAIVDGGQYYIYTEHEGTKYYVSASGWSQTDKANAAPLTFRKASGGTYKPTGWEMVISGTTRYTNAGNSCDGHIHTGTQNRATWERQVLFLNATTGKYAIRSTNAADDSGYRCNAFWYLHSYDDGNGAFMATDYDLENIGTAHFVWELEPVNEEQLNYQRSLNTLEDGGVYTIATAYVNGVKTETMRYLKADGTLTTDATRAKFFTFQKRNINNGYVGSGFKSGQFTNPTNASTPGTSIRRDSQNRDNWDTQAYFQNDEGLFAVRATNAATEITWGSNTYWSTDADGNACCMNDGAHYIWEVTQVGITPDFDGSTTYTITASNGRTLKNGESGGYLTVGNSGAGEYYITPASEVGQFYLRDLANSTYVTLPTGSKDGNGWKVGETGLPCIIQYITKDNINKYMITGVFGSNYSIASANYTSSPNVNNYSDNSVELSYWTLETTGNNTAYFVAQNNKPNRTYTIKNQANSKYISNSAETETNNAMVTAEADGAAKFLMIPVAGQTGYYYMYDTQSGNYLVPDNGHVHLNNSNWQWSTNPTAVQLRNNTENKYGLGTLTYTLGQNRAANGTVDAATSNDYLANYQQANPNQAINHWFIEAADDDATVEMNRMTANVESLVESAALVGTQLQYTANVGSAERGTVVVPFEADVTGTVEAYTLSAVNGETSKVVGTKVETIAANQPVLLKNQGTLVLTAKEGTLAYSDAPAEGVLHGVYSPTPAPVGSYVLQKQGDEVAFFHVEGTQPTVGAFRAYLETPGNARMLTIEFDDELTGIDGATQLKQKAESSKQLFDLQGRRVVNAQRGLYIVNGKKVVIK